MQSFVAINQSAGNPVYVAVFTHGAYVLGLWRFFLFPLFLWSLTLRNVLVCLGSWHTLYLGGQHSGLVVLVRQHYPLKASRLLTYADFIY
eukprot:XP_001710313.1 Hypothetical protein GL50803_31804 [Giardia lamblia ATCC 50803]